MNLTDFFDRIYIVNLPHRLDRREATVQALQSINIQMETGKVEFFPAVRPEHAEPFRNLGFKGCFLSVLSILKHFQEHGQEHGSGHVLILEDDVQFSSFFNKEIDGLLKRLSEQPWDIAQFGYLSIDDATPAELDVPFGTWKDMTNTVIGGHFVAINGQALDRYIQFMEGLLTRPVNHPEGGPMSPDGALTVFRQLNPDSIRLLAMPSFGGQRSSRSDISPKWFDRIPFLSWLAERYRQNLKVH